MGRHRTKIAIDSEEMMNALRFRGYTKASMAKSIGYARESVTKAINASRGTGVKLFVSCPELTKTPETTVKPGKSADTAVLGTQGYAAPEQFGFKQTDKKTDIYAVGVLINYMLTACLPNEKTAAGHFGNIVRKCTKPDPSDRYRCAQEIIYALNHPVLGVNIFCYIPGFRSGKSWHRVIATVYYLFLVLLVLVLSVGEDNKMSFPVFLFILLDFIAPVLILTDFLDWPSRFKFTVFMKKSRLIALKIALTVLCAAPIPVVAFCRELFK